MKKKRRFFPDSWGKKEMALWRMEQELDFIEKLMKKLPATETYTLRDHYFALCFLVFNDLNMFESLDL